MADDRGRGGKNQRKFEKVVELLLTACADPFAKNTTKAESSFDAAVRQKLPKYSGAHQTICP
jgi:hypothetical protein